MTKSDTWPGGVTMEPLSNLDSAGSCDSVISVNSGYSDDSMEHLSAEERACLMYLEETIEALEVQEDSGLSNDEPDPGSQAGKTGWMRENDVPSFKSDEYGGDHNSEPGSREFASEDKAEHHALNQTSEPQSSAAPAGNAKDIVTSSNLATQPESSNGDCKIHPSATQLCVSTDGNGHLQIVPSASLCPGPSDEACDEDVVVIPPPLDFMDEPGLPPSAVISNDEPGATVDLERLRQRASVKRTSVSSSVPPNKPPELSLPAVSSDPLTTPPPEPAEPRSPPAVAPKPKKLPANIILKSHKATVAVSDGHLEHMAPASSDRLLLDPQRVRMEALRKLGLLPAVADSSPNVSPKTRRSWAAPLSPLSPGALPKSPFRSSNNHVDRSPPACVPLQSPSATSTEVLPAPAAFSDPVGPPLSDNELSAFKEASAIAQANTPPLTPPSLVKHLTPPKVVGVKSATLERSGLGLSSYMASQDSKETGQESQLRKNRARPASLGNGKEFTSAGAEVSQVSHVTSKEPDLRRSLPAFQHSRDAQKLPRSEGISVLICPRAENEEDRRGALRKLGLLRD